MGVNNSRTYKEPQHNKIMRHIRDSINNMDNAIRSRGSKYNIQIDQQHLVSYVMCQFNKLKIEDVTEILVMLSSSRLSYSMYSILNYAINNDLFSQVTRSYYNIARENMGIVFSYTLRNDESGYYSRSFDLILHKIPDEYVNYAHYANELTLIKACGNKKCKDVIKLIKKGLKDKKIDTRTYNNALLVACENNASRELVKELVKAESNMYQINKKQHTAFSLACCSGNEEAALELLDNGYDFAHVNFIHRKYCLIYACKNNLSKIALILIGNDNIDINCFDSNKKSAFYYAVMNNMKDVCMAILKKTGKNLVIKNADEINLNVIKNKKQGLFPELIELYYHNNVICKINPLVEYAIKLKNEDFVSKIICSSGSVCDINKYLIIIPMLFENKMFSSLKILIESRDDVLKLSKIGDKESTLFLLCCEHNKEDLAIKCFEIYKKNYKFENNCGYTALYYVNKHNMARLAIIIKEFEKNNSMITI